MIKKYNITVNGKAYEVDVEEVVSESGSVSRPQVVQQNKTQVQAKQPAPKPQVSQPAGSGSICAPMPGTINDVKVKVGDAVKKGQVLLILEAMKMENEIMASCDGVVNSVEVGKGTSVSVGDVLVTIG